MHSSALLCCTAAVPSRALGAPGQELSRPLRRPLQATRLAPCSCCVSRRTARLSFAACSRSQATFCRCASSDGFVPADGVRSEGRRYETGRVGGGQCQHFLVHCLHVLTFVHLLNELCCCSQGKTVPLPGDGTHGAAPWYPLRDSNPQHLLPLGSAPAPRAPLWAPTAERPPLPLTPAPPGTLCSGSVAGSGDVAAQRAAAASRRSCEPPSDQPQEAYERRRCICGGGPQCMRPAARRARPRGEGPHVECCVLQLAG